MKLQQADETPYEEVESVSYDSDVVETGAADDSAEDEENGEEGVDTADLGGGWGRIVFMPVRRGRQVAMNVCRSTNRDATEGSFDRIVVTQSKNPTLHQQAKKSIWGDLWPC